MAAEEAKPETKPEPVVEESTSFTCKKCGKKKCYVTEKYKDSLRAKMEWCGDCAYDLEDAEWRLNPLVEKVQEFMTLVKPFPEMQEEFVKKVTKILKS